MADQDRIVSEDEMRAAFRVRDRKQIELPQNDSFPIVFSNYYTWCDGSHRFLILRRWQNRDLIGMVFRSGPQVSSLGHSRQCDWCHAQGSAEEIDILTVVANPRKTVGLYLCSDLSCQNKLEVIARLIGRDYDTLVHQMLRRMIRFYENNIEHASYLNLVP